MMFWLAQSGPLDFYRVQGMETGMPHQLMSGNLPWFSGDKVAQGLLAGLCLLVLAWVLSLDLKRTAARRGLSARSVSRLRLLILVGFFVAWEAALSLPGLRADGVYLPDPRAFWKANPQHHDRIMDTGTGIAGVDRPPQIGIFDQEHVGPKPPGVFRIAFMGDSQVISSGRSVYAGKWTYPKVLETSLHKLGLGGPDGQPVQVINAGMSGHSSWQGLMLLRSEVLPLEPDLVVLAFGYHDSNRSLSRDREVLTDDPLTWRVRTLMYRSRLCLLLRTVILRAQAFRNDRTPPERLQPRVSPQEFAQNLRTFADLGRRRSFRVVFLLEPFAEASTSLHSAQHRLALQEVARDLGVEVLDVHAAFERLPPDLKTTLFDDRIHLTTKGHARMAAVVLEGLVEAGILNPGGQGPTNRQ